MVDPFGPVSRWEAVHDALVGPAGAVTALAERVIFGAALYTSNGGNAGGTCPMLQETPPRADNLGAIKMLLETNGPAGDTPTAESIDAVVGGFPRVDVDRPGPRVIVLATDGSPDNCTDPDAHNQASRDLSEAAVARAYEAGISTYVLSVGTGVLKEHLDRIADIGVGAAPGSGTGEAKVATNPAALVAAFDQLIRGARGCRFNLDGSVNANRANDGTVTLDGTELEYQTDWILVDDSTLELQGAACEAVKQRDDAVLDAEFPCGVVVL